MYGSQQQQQAYGSPGHHFAGRRNLQNPGGNSSLSLGDGSNYSPFAPRYPAYGSAQQTPPKPFGSSSAYAGQPYGAPPAQEYNSLATQLNLPQNARRPPSAGRRAHAPAGPGYQASASPYGYQSPYNQGGGSILGGSSSPGPGPSPYGGLSSTPSAYGASPGFAGGASYGGSGYGGSGSPQAVNGGMGPLGGGGYGGAGSPQGLNAGGAAYGGGGVGGGYGGYAGGMGGGAPIPKPAAPTNAPFVAEQKGAFAGKVSMQPPGGRQTLNIFGGY
ncbi:hypothetical protein DUNSADRAFT_17901 [Dunaliella salina]|uniref:Uncharacterized protein n=1 Tax=Dunaliella salina TaxID=3046 RepID=A0ABQ7H8Y5_DUNSA|nr:hypothetical protein DUNSADRAFT_17901 [Dunaliella salina]|eukprot:KAF5843323.1 hypothetical protein DUNSADRAFT_17901 [Dunaliella salina]